MATGESFQRYVHFKKILDSHHDFLTELQEKSFRYANEKFMINEDFYYLYVLIRIIKPKIIIETGVFDGYSSAMFLRALEDNFIEDRINGTLLSIDYPAYSPINESTTEGVRKHLPHGCEPGWVIPDSLRSRWQSYKGDSLAILPEVLMKVGRVDLFHHDSLHTYEHMKAEFEMAWPFIPQGGYLMSHDIHWNKAFEEIVKKFKQKEYAAHSFGLIRKNY